ncbi:MAG: hypothetical protein C4290_06895 [Chloroflexota bacterium]
MRWRSSLIFVLGVLVGLIIATAAVRRPAAPTSNPDSSPARAGTPGTVPRASDSATPPAGHTHPESARDESATCGLPQAAFCDTFDSPAPGGRGGDLDERRWSFARYGNGINPSQGDVNVWRSTTAQFCLQTITNVLPPNDSFICGQQFGESNHWMEAFDDRHGRYIWNAARIRQPFDFAGRTGTIAFDVDMKSQTPTGHGWWLAIWLTDEPVPAPYQFASLPRNGLGVELVDANCGTSDGSRSGVGAIYLVRNYQLTTLSPQGIDCVLTAPDRFNHVELRLSQQRLEVWASDFSSDHGMTFPNFRRIGALDGLNLPFSRGYVHLEHIQYNAEKGGLPSFQTYHWDNIGFDGPVLPTPRAYDLPDALTPAGAGDDGLNLGYSLKEGGMWTCCPWQQIGPFSLSNVDLTGATAAALNLNVWFFTPGTTLRYRFNGGPWRAYPSPFTDTDPRGRAVHIPVPLSDLRPGTNTLEFQNVGTTEMAIANLDLTIELAGPPSPQ